MSKKVSCDENITIYYVFSAHSDVHRPHFDTLWHPNALPNPIKTLMSSMSFKRPPEIHPKSAQRLPRACSKATPAPQNVTKNRHLGHRRAKGELHKALGVPTRTKIHKKHHQLQRMLPCLTTDSATMVFKRGMRAHCCQSPPPSTCGVY